MSRGAGPPARASTGLFHVAIRFPTRRALATALRRVIDAEIRLEVAADHGVSEAVYLSDPDNNGVELYCDRPRELWPRREDGSLQLSTAQLDLGALLAELQL